MNDSNHIEMKIDRSRAKTLVSNIQAISELVSKSAKGRNVRLVAVSKLKPATDILALHQAPVSQLHFGENYAQELTEKAEILPRSILWHFIGGLQSNKCKPLAAEIPNLWCVSSVDTIKKATQLDKGRSEIPSAPEPLRIHVQVNTSGEDSKSGCLPGAETLALCRHIKESCPHLSLLGLMTIGAIARSKASSTEVENEDFIKLREERDSVARELCIPQEELELSMGMSDDFEAAIVAGSSEVRVGSTIFGQRPAKADFKVKETVEESSK